jgi:hypothetical protein
MRPAPAAHPADVLPGRGGVPHGRAARHRRGVPALSRRARAHGVRGLHAQPHLQRAHSRHRARQPDGGDGCRRRHDVRRAAHQRLQVRTLSRSLSLPT